MSNINIMVIFSAVNQAESCRVQHKAQHSEAAALLRAIHSRCLAIAPSHCTKQKIPVSTMTAKGTMQADSSPGMRIQTG